MEFIRLKSTQDNYFDKAWKLYNSSFPADEQRTENQQVNIIGHSSYHFEIIHENQQFLGFILWWKFENLCFIDHFATSPNFRNKGLGTRVLNAFKEKHKNQLILLEVEHPNTPINQRRIGFYERLDFQLNPHFYQMPSYLPGGEPVDLLLMSYPRELTEKELKDFIEEHQPMMFEH